MTLRGNPVTFEFATATRILFGSGTVAQAAVEASKTGTRALVVTGRSPGRINPFVNNLTAAGVTAVVFSVSGEPDVAAVSEGIGIARREKCDVVIGIGGGSVIDTAKAIAALLANPGELHDYLEVIGGGQPLAAPSFPCIAIPTTAGTGAEVTRNAVIASPEHRVKVSLRSPFMLPRLAVIDPELTLTLPPEVTASTGLDALTQCIEAYVSVRANPLTDGLCLEGIERAARSLRKVCADGRNTAAREDMAIAGLMSGLALANAGLGAVHGFAAPIGGRCGVAHGTVCALLLPWVMEANVKASEAATPDNQALRRYTKIARICTGNPSATALDGLVWIQRLCTDLPLPPANAIGITRDQFPELVTAAKAASSMKGNPVSLSENQLLQILEKTFGGDN